MASCSMPAWSDRTGISSCGKEFALRGTHFFLLIVDSPRKVASLDGALKHFGICLAYTGAADYVNVRGGSGIIIYFF